VRRYQGIAHRTAFLVTREGAEAEDAAQTAFVKAYGALGRFDPDRPFRPWLLRIVTNEARNRVRSAARRSSLELAAGAQPSAAEPAVSPETTAVAQERRRALLGAVNGLGESDREVIAFRYFLELSEAETAQALGVARGTVKSRLSRALGRLRESLATAGIDAEDAGTAHD
jgi:RNA polymerase sigma-70 factor (ECF subfamily)